MPAKIIVLGNQMGGVGKTTAAVAISAELGKRGHRVEFLDFDIQGGATVNVSRGVGEEHALPFTAQHLAAVVRGNPKALRATVLRPPSSATI